MVPPKLETQNILGPYSRPQAYLGTLSECDFRTTGRVFSPKTGGKLHRSRLRTRVGHDVTQLDKTLPQTK